MATVEIDGKTLEVAEGTNLVEAAAKVGVLIPTYCYHPGLSVVGQCRICFVEVEGAPRLVTACSTPVRDRMVVRTETAKVREARAAVMEFLLANPPSTARSATRPASAICRTTPSPTASTPPTWSTCGVPSPASSDG
jgi:NADH dehydrogenase/NADH:ubiquinone oxidoreductase subunit G